MNDRRPYDDDAYGRQSAPQGPLPGQPPAPRAGGGWDSGAERRPAAPRPAPGGWGGPDAGAIPEQRPRPYGQDGRGHNEIPTGQWGAEDEENTVMIGKLGYVPRQARHPEMSEEFDTDNVSADDRHKFRTRKRAKKASPLAKVGVVGLVLVVVAAIGGGIWWLSSGDEESTSSGLAYEAVKKPCDLLDLSPLSGISGTDKVNKMRDEVDAKQHKTAQTCEVTLGEDGKVGSVQVYSEVFPRNAGAGNAFDRASEKAKTDSTETVKYAAVDGVKDGAFSVTRVPSADSKTIDYSLSLHDDNAYLYARVTLYDGTDAKEVAKYAQAIAEKYLEGWKG